MSDGFFDDSHVTDVGLQGSLGPVVSPWEMVQQGFRQQYRVDSARALDQELISRWAESIDGLRAAGQNFNMPVNPLMARGFAEYIRNGTPVTTPTVEGGGVGPNAQWGATINYDRRQPDPEFEEMRRANEAIRQLNNPHIKTFEQILDEVSTMQHDVEQQTASMSERTGALGTVAGMIGGIAGSFTTRDPLNIITAPIGFGRTIATRIATDMAVNAGVTALTDIADVNPNRALVGLPERNPYYDIALSALGAGLIRGGIEGIGAGLSRFHAAAGEDINFDFRDAQMQQMFAAHESSPTARAASSILDDTIVFEHANPYGDGHVAGYRWQAELEATARALNGEVEPHIELPPIPSDQIERSLSFQSVKETAPELWNELERARTQLADLDRGITETSSRELSIPDAVRLVDEEAAAKLDKLSEVVNNPEVAEPVRAAADMEARGIVTRVGQDKIMKAVEIADTTAKHEIRNLRASRKAANKTYRAAYQKVEAEAVRLEHAEVAKRSIAQTQAIDVLGPAATSEPMTGPMTRFDFVEGHGAKVQAAEAEIPTKAEAVNDLQINPETNTVDIGAKTPVSADFKVPFDEGELSVREVLEDLAEDQRLEEAVKGCTI